MSIFVYSQYSTDVPLVRGSIAKLKLDPINTAGAIDHEAQLDLSSFAPFAKDAYLCLNDRNYLEKKLRQPEDAKEFPREEWSKKATKNVWKSHIDDLKRFHVLKIGLIAMVVISTYFAVAKSCGTLARSIFSGHGLSTFFVRPSSVNLPQLPHVLAAAAAIIRQRSEVYILTADVRHYFHSISLGDEVRSFFTIYIAAVLYHFCVLPMGWSFSPRIAQSLAWAAILSLATDANGLRLAAEKLKTSAHPPSYVVLHDDKGQPMGILFIWYDNFVAIIGCRKMAMELSCTLTKMTERFKFHWGQKDLFHPVHLRKLGASSMKDIDSMEECPARDSLIKNAVAVGIQFGSSERRLRGGQKQINLQWRIKPKSVGKAKELLQLISSDRTDFSCRILAAVCGVCVWRIYVSCEPLTKIHDVLVLSSRAGKRASNADWGANITVNESERLQMKKALGDVLRNDWNTIVPLEHENVIILASDASLLMGSWTEIHTESIRRSWDNWYWCEPAVDPKTDTKRPVASHEIIFLLELKAAERAILNFASKNRLIVLLIDNTAAAACLRRFYSTHAEARKILDRVWNHLNQLGGHLLVVGIPSEDNDADPPSREEYPSFCSKRLKSSYETAMRAFDGCDRLHLNSNGMGCSHFDESVFEEMSASLKIEDSSPDDDETTIDGHCDHIASCVAYLEKETTLA